MATYSEDKAVLLGAPAEIATAKSQVDNMLVVATQIQTRINGLISKYSSTATSIEAALTADSTNIILQADKAQKDKLAADIQTLKGRIDTIVTALTGL